MPIQAQQFSVPLLSPASLLDDQGGDSGIDRAMEQGLDFYFRQQLEQSSQAAALQRQQLSGQQQIQQTYEYLRGQGDIIPVADAPQFALPGEEPIRYSEIASPTGERFVSRAEVNQAQQAFTRAQPLGKDYLPGTTVGDVFNVDAAGNQQVRSDAIFNARRVGDLSALRTQIEGIPENLGSFRQTMLDALGAAEKSGGAFTRGEQLEFEAGINAPAMNTYLEASRAETRYDRQQLGAISQQQVNLLQRYEVIDRNTGARRNLRGDEASLLARRDLGEPLSLSEAEYLSQLEVDLEPRITAADYFAEMNSAYVGASNAGEVQEYAINWFEGKLLPEGPDGEPNMLLARDMQRAGYPVTHEGIRAFFNNFSASEPYRAAFALTNRSLVRAEDIQAAKARGERFPFGLTGAMGALQKIYGDQFSQPVLPPALDRTPSAGNAVTGAAEESAYLQMRADMAMIQDQIGPTATDALTQAFNSGDVGQMNDALVEASRNSRDETLISNLEDIVRDINDPLMGPALRLIMRDSIWTPARRR